MGIPGSCCSAQPCRDSQATVLCSGSTVHLPWHQSSRYRATLSPTLAGLQLPAKMPQGTCHSCQDCLPLKLAPAQKTQAFPEVLVTGNAKQMSSFPTGEQDIFPQNWAITTPSLAISAGERGKWAVSSGLPVPRPLLPSPFFGHSKAGDTRDLQQGKLREGLGRTLVAWADCDPNLCASECLAPLEVETKGIGEIFKGIWEVTASLAPSSCRRDTEEQMRSCVRGPTSSRTQHWPQ